MIPSGRVVRRYNDDVDDEEEAQRLLSLSISDAKF